MEVTTLQFHQDLWPQKTRFPKLSCSVVYGITRLVVLTENQIVMDGQTRGHRAIVYIALALHCAVKIPVSVLQANTTLQYIRQLTINVDILEDYNYFNNNCKSPFTNCYFNVTTLASLSNNVLCLLAITVQAQVSHYIVKLECGPMTNVMAAKPNIGGALCESSVG